MNSDSPFGAPRRLRWPSKNRKKWSPNYSTGLQPCLAPCSRRRPSSLSKRKSGCCARSSACVWRQAERTTMRQPPKPAPMPPPSERFTSRAGTGLLMFLSLLVVQRGGDSLRFWRCSGATRKEREREKKRLGEEHCCSSISTAARFPTPKSSSFQPLVLFFAHTTTPPPPSFFRLTPPPSRTPIKKTGASSGSRENTAASAASRPASRR